MSLDRASQLDPQSTVTSAFTEAAVRVRLRDTSKLTTQSTHTTVLSMNEHDLALSTIVTAWLICTGACFRFHQAPRIFRRDRTIAQTFLNYDKGRPVIVGPRQIVAWSMWLGEAAASAKDVGSSAFGRCVPKPELPSQPIIPKE